MKFVVEKQHYDLAPGTVVSYVKESVADSNMYGMPYMVAKNPKGELVVLPYYKLKPTEGNTEVFNPFDTVNS